jgi:hypothetical protein
MRTPETPVLPYYHEGTVLGIVCIVYIVVVIILLVSVAIIVIVASVIVATMRTKLPIKCRQMYLSFLYSGRQLMHFDLENLISMANLDGSPVLTW